MTACPLRKSFEAWVRWANWEAARNSGVIEAFGFFTIRIPRAVPTADAAVVQGTQADADESTEADTTAYVSCTDGGTGTDTDEGTDADAVAAHDTRWPNTDDGF